MSHGPEALVPMLMCDDVPASIDFYTGMLGFTVDERLDDAGASGWAALSRGQIQLMLASGSENAGGVKVDGRFPQVVFYFYPEDLEGLRDSIVAAGWPVSELRSTSYGMREFDLVDPSGHALWFGQTEAGVRPGS